MIIIFQQKFDFSFQDKTQKLESQVTQLKTSYSNLEEEKAQSENELSEKLKNNQVQKDKEIEKLQSMYCVKYICVFI